MCDNQLTTLLSQYTHWVYYAIEIGTCFVIFERLQAILVKQLLLLPSHLLSPRLDLVIFSSKSLDLVIFSPKYLAFSEIAKCIIWT